MAEVLPPLCGSSSCLDAICVYDELHGRDDIAWVIEPPGKGEPWGASVTVYDRQAFIRMQLTAEFIFAREDFLALGPKMLLRKLAAFKARGRPTAATAPADPPARGR